MELLGHYRVDQKKLPLHNRNTIEFLLYWGSFFWSTLQRGKLVQFQRMQSSLNWGSNPRPPTPTVNHKTHYIHDLTCQSNRETGAIGQFVPHNASQFHMNRLCALLQMNTNLIGFEEALRYFSYIRVMVQGNSGANGLTTVGQAQSSLMLLVCVVKHAPLFWFQVSWLLWQRVWSDHGGIILSQYNYSMVGHQVTADLMTRMDRQRGGTVEESQLQAQCILTTRVFEV